MNLPTNLPTNRATPHPTELTAPCHLAKIEGFTCITLTTPCCKAIMLHAPPFAEDMGAFTRRSCGACTASYWLNITGLPPGMSPARFIREWKPQKRRRS